MMQVPGKVLPFQTVAKARQVQQSFDDGVAAARDFFIPDLIERMGGAWLDGKSYIAAEYYCDDDDTHTPHWSNPDFVKGVQKALKDQFGLIVAVSPAHGADTYLKVLLCRKRITVWWYVGWLLLKSTLPDLGVVISRR